MKTNVVIEIEIIHNKDDESGFEISLDEAVKNIKRGCYTGFDGNEDEEYKFSVKSEDDDCPKMLSFRNKSGNLTGRLEDLIKSMPEKGNTTEECQRLNLLQMLNKLKNGFNGTGADDLIETQEG